MLAVIKEKFTEQEQEWEEDFAKELQRFSKEQLMGMEDENVFADLLCQAKSGGKPALENRKSSVVERLKKSLRDENITFEDVKNILIRDREERERDKIIKKNHDLGKVKRLSLQQMGFIKDEFMKPPGDMGRDVKMLDRVLKDLKFFKRFDHDTR
jgi:hypothetical protein